MISRMLIVSGAGAFKRGHYSRVQALLEFLSDSVHCRSSPIYGTRISLLVEKPPKTSDWAYDIDVSDAFDVSFYGKSPILSNSRSMAMKGVSSILGAIEQIGKKYDVAISSMIQGGLLGWSARNLGIVGHLVYDDMDYYPGFVQNSYGRRLVHMVEERIVRGADVVASVSPSLSELRRKQGARQVLVSNNGVNPAQFDSAYESNTKKPNTNLVLLYSGSLSRDIWGLDIIIKSIKIIREKRDVTLRIVGGGPELAYLKNLARDLGIQKCIQFVGAVEHRELASWFEGVSMGLAIGMRNSAAEHADPIKVKEYIAAGVPFVGTDLPELRRIAEETSFGHICRPTPQSLADAVLDVWTDLTRFRQIATDARRLAIEKYSWDTVFKGLLDSATKTLKS